MDADAKNKKKNKKNWVSVLGSPAHCVLCRPNWGGPGFFLVFDALVCVFFGVFVCGRALFSV
jgi:hypothetical protein